MFVLEALRAKHGDALLLHYGKKEKPKLMVIDGGPPKVYADALKPRLEEIRAERKLGPNDALDIELMMVSHLDEDHISGILDFMKKQRDLKEGKKPLPYKIKRFWHNAFDDVVGRKDKAMPASIGDDLGLIVASVGQGRDLRKLVDFFKLNGNDPYGSLVMSGVRDPIDFGGVEFQVVGPDKKRLEELQAEWDKKLPDILKKERAKAEAYDDKSPYNLSSIVLVARAEGKTMLLTGDALGKYTLDVLEEQGLLDAEDKTKPLHVDLLKLPHHGSIRNVELDYFQRITADHYVVSADGKHGNPDVETLELLSQARPDDDFTLWLTNPPEEFVDAAVGKKVAAFLAKEKKGGRKYRVVCRKPGELGVKIALA